MINNNDFLTTKDIKEFLHIGNDKLYGNVLNDKRIIKFKIANRYYIDTKSFLYFLKGTRNIDFSKITDDRIKKDTLPHYVNVKEFCELFGISKNTAYKYINKYNTFPATKIGQQYYIWIDLVLFWLQRMKK